MATQKKHLTAKSLMGYSNIISAISKSIQRTLGVKLTTPKPIPTDVGIMVLYHGGRDQIGVTDLEKFKSALLNLDGYQVEEFDVVANKLKFAKSSRTGVMCSIFLAMEDLSNGEMVTLEVAYCSSTKVLTISGY